MALDIAFHDLRIGYGGRAVLSDITATLPGGGISVILGGSGCGKSTLLRHIMGLARPMSGSISIGDIRLETLDSRGLARLRRRMGVLFQDGALLGALTLGQNAALPLSEHLRLDKKLLREAALRVLGMVGLEKFIDFYPNELSGGMRKRAGLARAIIAGPAILLCDEPTSGLDPITAARMDQLLLSMHAQSPDMSIVVVSHDLASLKKIADYVLVLGDGRALFQGSLESLLRSDDPYIREFLNREPGKLEADFAAPRNPQVEKALERWLDS